MKRGFGSTAVMPLLCYIVYRYMGALGMPLMWIWILALVVIGETVRELIGYENLWSIRTCVLVMSLVPRGSFVPLYPSKAAFLGRAVVVSERIYKKTLILK